MLMVCLALICVNEIAHASFDNFVIRNSSTSGTPPTIQLNNDYVKKATEFIISEGGMKAGSGSNDINGIRIGQIGRLSITRYDDTGRFIAGSGPAVAPYFNIWVTDGAGKYAVIANEPSNPAFQSLFTDNGDGSKSYDLSFADLSDKRAKVYETCGWNTNSSWVHNLFGSDPLTFSDLASLIIAPPPPSYIQNSANCVGTGAPDEIGTDIAYGFTWVFGDTLSNYVSGDEGYVVASPVAAGPRGFVTGGGWIDSPEGAFLKTVWDQGFEYDASGWFDNDDYSGYGYLNRVASGTGGIISSSGEYHALVEGFADDCPSYNSAPQCYYGPFSRFDGYRDSWLGTWKAEIDIYLDPTAWSSGQGFDYSVAANGSDGSHQRDYIFHVTKDTLTDKLLVAGSNNTTFSPREDLENINHYEVTTAGWYTLQHVFYESSGALAVDLNLLDSNDTVLFTETRYNAADLIPDEVGGNRYSWFTHVTVPSGISVDNHQLIFPSSSTGKANFGFVSKYKKGASVPTGNTEFVFQAADLNFHSSSYDWLVINQSGTNAQFKGEGTINGEGNYKFMLWAGDGDPDTLRMKIWYEDNGSEVIVYDNGMDQAIGDGSIIVHTKKN
jgi:hypothetical protein